MSVCLSVCLFVRPSVRPSCLSVCLSVRLSVRAHAGTCGQNTPVFREVLRLEDNAVGDLGAVALVSGAGRREKVITPTSHFHKHGRFYWGLGFRVEASKLPRV